MIKIDKGIPMPAHGKYVYPWDEMIIGDSFLVPDGRIKIVRTATTKHNQRFPEKHFVTRRVDDEYRVWRIK